MEVIKRVLKSFDIHSFQVKQITDNLHQIQEGPSLYALKRSSLTGENMVQWEHALHQANMHQLDAVLPIYITKSGSFYHEESEDVYYLTPWIEKGNVQLQDFYRTIGQIHKQTKQTKKIDGEEIVQSFKGYQVYCQETSQRLLMYVEQFEGERYMSPFQLQVCTHYHQLERSLQVINDRLKQFMEEQKTSRKWCHTLCHGNLQLSHLVGKDGAYFINWEDAYIGDPTLDLAIFLKNEAVLRGVPEPELIDSFAYYMEENALTKSELFLLVIHLLDPADYIQHIQRQMDKATSGSMIAAVQELERFYRRIVVGLRLSDYIEKEYEMLPLQDSED